MSQHSMYFRFILFNTINFIVIFIILAHYKRNVIIIVFIETFNSRFNDKQKNSTCFEYFDNSVLLHFKMRLFAFFPFRDALFFFRTCVYILFEILTDNDNLLIYSRCSICRSHVHLNQF